MNGAQITRMNSQARKNMVKGLTAQLMIMVSKTGFGALTALTTSLKSIWTMIGYIMAKSKSATGIFTWATEREFKKPAALGKAAPRPIPIRIQRATQRVRYLWKKLNAYSFLCAQTFHLINGSWNFILTPFIK